MRNRTPAATVLAAAVLASVAALSGCGHRSGSAAAAGPGGKHATGSSPAASPSSVPSSVAQGGGAAAPNIPVVRLGTSFVPRTLRLGAGQQFLVIVGGNDKAAGSGISGTCTPATAATFSSDLLSLRCQGGSYLYKTLHPGSGDLSVTVRPNCAAGGVCPQWIASATLKLTITN